MSTSLLSAQVGALIGHKTLEQEIIDVLSKHPTPLSCSDIEQLLDNPPDRETLSREVFRMRSAGMVSRASDAPAPAGMPRKTVATYRLPTKMADEDSGQEPVTTTATGRSEPGVAAAKPGVITRQDVLDVIKSCPAGVPRRVLIKHFGPTKAASVDNHLSALVQDGLIYRPDKGVVAIVAAQGSDAVDETRAVEEEMGRLTRSFDWPGLSALSVPPAASEDPSASPLEFALWCDGRLVICDGGELTAYSPDDTRRLFNFLTGCTGFFASTADTPT